MNGFSEISLDHDITIVEGAGGLMVPILPGYTYADLAKVLKLPLIVVAANKLGMINHLLLTLEHASCKGLSVLAYVLNQIESAASLAAETNRETLSALTAVPCAAAFSYCHALETGKSPPVDWFEERLEPRILDFVLNCS
jgi:dethiobiotin synthetase